MGELSDSEKLIYDELVRSTGEIRTDLRDMREALDQNSRDTAAIKTDLAVHKVRTGILGSIGGALVMGVKELVVYLRSGGN